MEKDNLGTIREVIINLSANNKIYSKKLADELNRTLVKFGARKTSDANNLGNRTIEYDAGLVNSISDLEDDISTNFPKLNVEYSEGVDEDSLEYHKYYGETLMIYI